MPYEELTRAEARQRKKQEREQLRLLNSELMQDLREEFSSAPREVRDEDTLKRQNEMALKEREEIEEDAFVRFGGRRKLLVGGVNFVLFYNVSQYY
eukprot:m.95010 g.95010  ORF g.95010 m.95010 type:complete len:96 (-) comp13473_c0_seq3:284-571(-)